MNPSKGWVALTAPVTMIIALVVAIPLLFGGSDCDSELTSATGPTSDAVSIMSWNVCTSSCGRWNQRIGPATEQVGRISPDILAVQEGGHGAKKRVYTFKGFGSLGYATGNHKKPYIGRYIFYKPGKFDLLASGSFNQGGNHGMAWTKLRTKADGVTFTVVDVHLAFQKSANAKRKAQMTAGLARVRAAAGSGPLVFVGDFNSNKSRSFDAPAAVMKNNGYTDARSIASNKLNENVNSARGRSATAPVKRHGNQTDHIYVPAGSSVSSWQQVVAAEGAHYVAPFISDHNAIMATTGLPSSKAANPVKPDTSDASPPRPRSRQSPPPGPSRPPQSASGRVSS